ncbi:MAG: ATP-binding cassette domain-containing protein [Spirochaetia bacterium]|nr:ATP-binding cassette domain-containing protein [Spirochaetia bacterium]
MLKAENLTRHYNLKAGKFSGSTAKVHALNGVSFTLERQQTLGIVGESGCGKTTLAKTILGIERPDAGHLYLDDDRDLYTLDKEEFRKKRMEMQYIFQDPYMSLNPKMQIKDIITEPLLRTGRISRREIEVNALKILDMVGLPQSSLHKYPHEFSGGQRQRICIGRAISSQPKLIICDEPVSALDVSIQSQILNLLLQIQNELAISYIFIAHNIAVVLYMSDIVSVMYAGRIVESAPPEELYRNPLHPYTKLLLSVIPEIGKNKRIFEKKITGEIPDLINVSPGCPFYDRCPVRQERCALELPPLQEITPGHLCTCWK